MKLLSYLAIYIGCTLFSATSFALENVVIVALITLAIFCFSLFFDKDILRIGTYIVFWGLTFLFPEMVIYLPLLILDIILCRIIYLAPFALLSVISSIHILQGSSIAFLIAFSVAVAFLSIYQNLYQQLTIKYKSQRDTNVESENHLVQKNRMLLAKQDSEIHIATLKERNRIAREIHDNVGHMLSRSILQVAALSMINKDEIIDQNLGQLKNTLDEAMINIRQSVHKIHEDAIDLEVALNELLAPLSEYQTHLDYDMSNHLPKEIKYTFIAIVKESLSNFLKHSDGDQIHIISREHPAFFQLAIEDNGIPDSKLLASPTGIGLENIKERVESLHGSLAFNTDNGFKTFITIPKNTL